MQQRAEVPTWQQRSPQEATLPFVEKKSGPEQSWFMRLGESVAETVKDIKTASNMAKRKFDGDSALMHAARGGLIGAVGAGLEFATDAMFDSAWRGEGPIWERFVMGESAGKKLAAFAQTHPRWSHFIKEGTQDVSLAALYNFLAYRSQPIFESVDGAHVLQSVAVNALEAGLLKSIPAEMQKTAANINRPAIKSVRQKYRGGQQFRQNNSGTFAYAYPMDANQSADLFNKFLKFSKSGTPNKPTAQHFTKTRYHNVATTPVGVSRENLLGKMFNISNPVTIKGLEMVWSGLSTFAKNYKEIKKTKNLKKWSGGKAYIPQRGENATYYGSSHNRYNNKRRDYNERFEDT